MDPSLTEYIYKHYQPSEYYRRYLKQQNIRSDNRKVGQHRPLKINISPNTVVINLCQTTILASLSYKLEQVIYSPVTSSYGQDLIKINVENQVLVNTNKYDRNTSRAIQQFINVNLLGMEANVRDQALAKKLEKQLVFEVNDSKGTKFMAFMLDVNVSIASNDGGIRQYCLFATQILLWCATIKIPEFLHLQKKQLMLDIPSFIFPIRYCQILDEILIDPTSSESRSSNFEITIMKDLLSSSTDKPIIIHYAHNNNQSPSAYTEQLNKLYDTQVSKFTFDIRAIRLAVENGNKYQTITVKNI